MHEAFRLEGYFDQLVELNDEMEKVLKSLSFISDRKILSPAIRDVVESMKAEAPGLFGGDTSARRSDFFRDLAAAGYMSAAEQVAAASKGAVNYERLTGVFDRAILDVETRLQTRDFGAILRRAARRLTADAGTAAGACSRPSSVAASRPIDEMSFVGTGYGRQTLPFPKQAVKSEILCHGRGAHRCSPARARCSTSAGRTPRPSRSTSTAW